MINPDNLDDNNDCFHDSYDRLLSSTTSTSSSSSPSNYYYSSENDDADDDVMVINPNNCTSVRDYNIIGRLLPVPRFPLGVVNSYDVWISRPSSVDERRVRLLRQLGLVRDTDQLEASVSSVYDFGLRHENCVGNPVDCVGLHNRCQVPIYDLSLTHENCVSNTDDCVGLHNRCQVPIYDLSLTHENCVINTDDSVDCVGLHNRCQVLKHDNSIDGEAVEGVCLIKDLDNGKEFVVDEVREDGMWGKVKEVGTGRRLTMEEFEMCVGHSPIVQELMRRQNFETGGSELLLNDVDGGNSGGSGSKSKKKGGWLKSIKNVASSVTGSKERRSSDERDTSSEKGGRRSSSATDDSQDGSFHGPERVRVRQYGKSCKDLTALYKSQEIQAHNGSIWTIKFSLDGKYLASAGEDCLIHVWEVGSTERKGDLLFDKQEDGNLNVLLMSNGSPEPTALSTNLENVPERKRRGRLSISRKSISLDPIVVPDTVFALSEKPICSFNGHLEDVLDLSWSKSQHLLSSSMDKTVRLWQLSSKSCLKIFSHSDYVTCIQFNPVDDRYFISGSLDSKVRIWSIPDRQVVDWNDLHEMVTAACYTPDGQAALVGSYKGSCRLYNTTDNRLQQKSQINLQNKKKKPHHKKITGFQFAPGSKSEVLITSADSRIRVVDGVELIHKFKGFRNTNSQISACMSANGRYVVCASEDSNVYIWKHEPDSRASRNKGVTVTQSYEHFHCQDVSMAIPWPGISDTCWGFGLTEPTRLSGDNERLDNEASTANHPPTPEDETNRIDSSLVGSPLHGTISSASNGYFFDRISPTWPEEKLVMGNTKNPSPRTSVDFTNGLNAGKSAWGMVIVTAGLRGEIRTFQNFGMPVRI